MKLSDVVSALHLSIFAEIPLLICFGVFVGVLLHIYRSREPFEALSALPLRNDGAPVGAQRVESTDER